MPKGKYLNFLLDLEEIGKKRCTYCGILKDKTAFGSTKSSKDGLAINCKECRKIICKKYEENNKEKIKEKWTAYNKTEKRKENSKRFYRKNLDYYKKKSKEISQRPEAKEKVKNYAKNKYKTDPVYRLHSCFSALLRVSLKKNRISSFSMVPYTINEYKDHLERQFDKNMNWENYGSYWQVDHIIPRINFNYTSYLDEEFKKCWALENLRPLEKGENSRKNDRTPEEYEEYKQKMRTLMNEDK